MLELSNIDAPSAARAVLSVLPLDTFVDDPATTMEVVGEPDTILPVHADIARVLEETQGKSTPLVRLERFAFYDLANSAFCIIRTGERRFYGNFALRKGVVPPDKG